MERAFGPSRYFSNRFPGALPQAGIAAGLWPFRKYIQFHQQGPKARPIPAWDDAPGYNAHPTSEGQRPDQFQPTTQDPRLQTG